MTTDSLTLKLSQRAVRGKKVRRLRRGGVIPVHFYGRGTEPLALQADAGVLRWLLPRAGRNVPITVQVDGQKGESICFVREVQRHPVTETLLHVDFLRVDVSQTITAQVPVILDGEAPAVSNMDGTLLRPLQSLEVEALPMNIPAAFHLDISSLDDFEKALRVADIQVPANVTISRDPEDMVARVAPPRVEEEEAVAEEAAEGEEGEAAVEAPEGEVTESEG